MSAIEDGIPKSPILSRSFPHLTVEEDGGSICVVKQVELMGEEAPAYDTFGCVNGSLKVENGVAKKFIGFEQSFVNGCGQCQVLTACSLTTRQVLYMVK